MLAAGRRTLNGSKEALDEVMRSLIVKLTEEEEDGGAPLLVRAAVDPVGHLAVVSLMRCWDRLPCKHQLEAAIVAHYQQLKEDLFGCFVVKAQAASL